jgi:uncharacterized repeat protein (TIGR01451 family)
MMSNWGSAFPGDEVVYQIVVQNPGPAGFDNLQLTSTLPANLEVQRAAADRGDLTQNGNSLLLKIASLKPGETVEIEVRTKIKQSVAIGTRIVSQATLNYDGRKLPAYSNIVTVLVVDKAPAAQAQPAPTRSGTAYPAPGTTVATATANPTTPSAAATASSTPMPTDTAAAGTSAATAAPTSTRTPTATIGGTNTPRSPLPNTSSGVPLMGLALMGMTLLIRTVRIHREQSRI